MEGLSLFDTKIRQWSSRWGCSEPMQKCFMVESREMYSEPKAGCSTQVRYCRTCSVRLRRVTFDIRRTRYYRGMSMKLILAGNRMHDNQMMPAKTLFRCKVTYQYKGLMVPETMICQPLIAKVVAGVRLSERFSRRKQLAYNN